ncbi:MAG: acetyl-CoA synthase subunit gamma [Desulfuromonas sp.]|nr:MAG: acetyl-CoA synthase subunit gamma [Desulfuromonas sp.]
MRWGFGRDRYRIAPGLYAVGSPDKDAPVIVTANYKMSFDLVRRDLTGRSAWILVLETFGINVWCAAGKGTFGTEELVRRIEATKLAERLNHRRLIVPQLGAVGIAAHEITKKSGFRVIYGPVRCSDLPYFLDHNFEATTQMRRVTFSTWERLILTPVELTGSRKIFGWSVLVLLLLGGIGSGGLFSFGTMLHRGGAALLALFVAVLAGAVITPTLLPWLPGRHFAIKGAVTGGLIALAGALFWGSQLGTGNTLALLLSIPAVSAYLAMNFTGSTTFTSPTGVEKEMRQTIPYQAGALVLAGICWITAAF